MADIVPELRSCFLYALVVVKQGIVTRLIRLVNNIEHVNTSIKSILLK